MVHKNHSTTLNIPVTDLEKRNFMKGQVYGTGGIALWSGS